MEIGLIILVFGLIIALRLIAGGNIPYLSAFIRWWWNIGFKITAHIPFCGWMAHFIITKGDKKAEQEKLHYINIGKNADDFGTQMVNESVARERAREAELQERLRKEEERKNLEYTMRNRAERSLGTRDVHLNTDNSTVTVDGNVMSTKEFYDKTF